MAEGTSTDWQELCAAAAKEADPKKLASLIERILQALDERRRGFASPNRLGEFSQPRNAAGATYSNRSSPYLYDREPRYPLFCSDPKLDPSTQE